MVTNWMRPFARGMHVAIRRLRSRQSPTAQQHRPVRPARDQYELPSRSRVSAYRRGGDSHSHRTRSMVVSRNETNPRKKGMRPRRADMPEGPLAGAELRDPWIRPSALSREYRPAGARYRRRRSQASQHPKWGSARSYAKADNEACMRCVYAAAPGCNASLLRTAFWKMLWTLVFFGVPVR